jgi:hypothetical protein
MGYLKCVALMAGKLKVFYLCPGNFAMSEDKINLLIGAESSNSCLFAD